jgi:integrase
MSKGTRRAAGEGHVRRRSDGRWEARLSVPGRGSKSYYGKTQAEAVLKRNEARLYIGEADFDTSKLTVASYLSRWLVSVKQSIAPTTYVRYEQAIRRHVVPELGSLLLPKLGPAHIEVFKAALLGRRNLAPSTARQTLLVLSIALNRAVRWELITRNPATAVAKPKVPNEEGYHCLSEEEAVALIAYVHEASPRDEALYHVALKYGPREGELAALRWRDTDYVAKTFTIRVSKTGKGRSVRLAPATIELLKRHRKILLEEKMAAGTKYKDRGLMFPTERGEPQSPKRMIYWLRKHLHAAGLPEIRFHDLRDTAATLMIRDEFPVHLVARILGHKDPVMTLRRYAHVLADMEETGAEKLDRWAF